jgi:hypothetical protein
LLPKGMFLCPYYYFIKILVNKRLAAFPYKA